MRTLRLILASPLLATLFICSTAVIANAQVSPPAAAEEAAPLSETERARYLGVYEIETPDHVMQVRIYEAGDRLMALPDDDDEPSHMTPLGNHRFRPDLMSEVVVTFAVDGDRATSFSIVFPDERGTVVAIRKP